MSIVKFAGAHIPTCDTCGTEYGECYSFEEALKVSKAAGWKHRQIDGEWTDTCPDCLEDEE